MTPRWSFRWRILPFLALFALLLAWPAAESPAKEEAKAPPKPFGKAMMLSLKGIEMKRGPVPFRHVFHRSRKGLHIKCVHCHHEFKKTGEFQACRDCHLPTMKKEKLRAKKIFHKNCRGCHRARLAADPSLGERAPTRCKSCHTKT